MSNGQPSHHELLSAFLDGELTPEEQQRVEALLLESSDAREELEDFKAISRELKRLELTVPPINLREGVMAYIQSNPASQPLAVANRSIPRTLRLAQWGLWGASLASVAIILFGIGFLISRSHSEHDGTIASADASSDQISAPETGSTAEPVDDNSPALAEASESAPEMGPPPPADIAASNMMMSEPGPQNGFILSRAARPPEGVGIGDFYSYLDRTEDGQVVVVEAHVVDVRKALDQLQVLLTRNAIPTTTVSQVDGSRLDVRQLQSPIQQNLAVYVESDAERMHETLNDLQSQFALTSNSINGVQIAGILDSSVNTAVLNSPIPDGATPQPRFSVGGHSVQSSGRRFDENSPEESSGAPLTTMAAGMGGGASGSPDEALGQMDNAQDEEQASDDFEKSNNAEENRRNESKDFQTVLNVSNSLVVSQVRGNSIAGAINPQVLGMGTYQRGQSNYFQQGATAQYSASGSKKLDSGKRLRMLWVLQENPPHFPVEAPRPQSL